jgi:hypothetical protein
MLSNPKPGMRVKVRYNVRARATMPYHDRQGVVVAPSRKRPRNHLIAVGDELIIVPAGNLFAV